MKLPRVRISTLMLLVVIAGLIVGMVVQQHRYEKTMAGMRKNHGLTSEEVETIMMSVKRAQANAMSAIREHDARQSSKSKPLSASTP